MRFNLVLLCDRSSVDLGQFPIAEYGSGHASLLFGIYNLDKWVVQQTSQKGWCVEKMYLDQQF